MNILFCGDKNIQNGLLIAVISLLEHTKEDLDVYVLTLNMSVNDKHYEPIDGRLSDIVIQNYRRNMITGFVLNLLIRPVYSIKKCLLPICRQDLRHAVC